MADILFSKLKCLFLPCAENKYYPKFLKSGFLYYFAILLLVLEFAAVPFFAYLPKTGFFADLTKTSLIQLANSARQSLGYQPLAENQKLDQSAYLKAKDMLDKDYFAHNSPGGTTPWFWFQETGYDYKYAGENLAIGFLESEEVNQAWLDSPSHRKNILNANYSEIGLAVVSGEFQGRQTTVVVQLFGSPQAGLSIAGMGEAKNTPAPQESAPVENQISPSPEEAKLASSDKEEEAAKTVLSAQNEAAPKNDFATGLVSFFASDYYNLIQNIIFGSLIFVLLLLTNAVLFDIFVYRAYEIQYKDVLLKTLGFCLILAILLHFDKGSIIQLIPHDFRIY